jgi:hypothetical protein
MASLRNVSKKLPMANPIKPPKKAPHIVNAT